MYVLEGEGFHEPTTIYHHPYDHPYFGQIFLASLFAILGYPDSLNIPSSGSTTTVNANDIENLFLIPRLLIGILSILDTFLLFKITERRYNNTVAFIASVLLAVMPITWLLRKIILESLLLPFLLSSILFAVYLRTKDDHFAKTNISAIKNKGKIRNVLENNQIFLILFSGIFLGLAIFTKIPLFTMVPLIGYIIFKKTRKWKCVLLWLIPVVFIPSIWLIHAITIGEFDLWLKDMRWNSQRGDLNTDTAVGSILINSLKYVFQVDPIILILGIAGFFYCYLKRDYFILLWTIPFLMFLFVINFVSFFHLVPIIPAMCIASAKMIVDLSNKINNVKAKKILPFAIISVVGTFGIISTTLLITMNVNSNYYNMYSFLVQYLLYQVNNLDNTDNENNTTIMGRHWTTGFFWIPKFVFDLDIDYKRIDKSEDIPLPNKEDKFVLIVDKSLERSFAREDGATKTFDLHTSTMPLAVFVDKVRNYNASQYPYASMSENKPTTEWVQIRELNNNN